MSGERLTRRQFVARAATAGAIVGSASALGVARAVACGRGPAPANNAMAPQVREVAPVLSFHLDRPYLDLSGNAIPYQPPAGARGGEAIAQLCEADLFRLPL